MLTLPKPQTRNGVNCTTFVGIGGNGSDGQSAPKQLDYFCRFIRSLYASDFPKAHTIHVSGPGQDLFKARSTYIPQLARSSDFVLMSDADMVVPTLWWGYVERLFNQHPRLGAVAPLLIGDGYCQAAIQRFGQVAWTSRITWTVTDDIQEATPPDSDLEPISQQDDGAWCDGFTIFRAEMLRQVNAYEDTKRFRNGCQSLGWKWAVCAGVVILHTKVLP